MAIRKIPVSSPVDEGQVVRAFTNVMDQTEGVMLRIADFALELA
jgi:hypothetical protein